MGSDFVLTLIPGPSNWDPNCPHAYWRSWSDKANRTTLSAKSREYYLRRPTKCLRPLLKRASSFCHSTRTVINLEVASRGSPTPSISGRISVRFSRLTTEERFSSLSDLCHGCGWSFPWFFWLCLRLIGHELMPICCSGKSLSQPGLKVLLL